MVNLLLAFAAGGILCVIAQLLIDLTNLTPARILVLYVCSGVLLYAVGVYDKLFELFGCGVATPLIGFGAGIGRGVKEAIAKDGIFGILSGGLTATAIGITFSISIALFLALFFKGRSKRL